MAEQPTRQNPWDSDEIHREMPLPQLVGYDIVRLVGYGSMGYVYECTSAEHGSVAVKVLNFGGESSSMAVERFRREVTVGERIGHPGIPRVFDSGRLSDGRYFLTMELLQGRDLEAWWDAAGHTRAEALDMIGKALEPLAAAHGHGVVHRDLKPENVFVERDGRVRLLDFGVARSPDASENVRTATGIAVGTPVYMSPEQATRPAFVDARSDVWSAGVMLYEALCGELPFTGDSPHAVVLQACTAEPIPLAERVPEVHPKIQELVARCLSKDPRMRPADAEVLSTELKALLGQDDVRASLAGPAAAPSFRLSSTPTPMSFRPTEHEVPTLQTNLAVVDPEPTQEKAFPRHLVWSAALVLLASALLLWSLMRQRPTEAAAGAPQSAGDDGAEASDIDGAGAMAGTLPTAGAEAAPSDPEPPHGATAGDAPRAYPTIRDATGQPQAPSGLSGAQVQASPAAGAPVGQDGQPTRSADPGAAQQATSVATAESPVTVQGSGTNPTAPAPAAPPPASSVTDAPEPAPTSAPTTTSSMSTVSTPTRPRPRPPTEMRPERPDFVTF